MEMNPQQVRNAEFQTVRKGADPDEVRAFLGDVADELERAQNQSTAMEARARAAVARLQELSEESSAAAPVAPTPSPARIEATVDEAETISRTLLLAQRTADTAIAEAEVEAALVLARASEEAATTLDSTREMSASLLAEARDEARMVGESERLAVSGEVDSLKARRDFLESDVDHLETFLVDQRTRIREAATSLIDISDRVNGGLADVRRPLLSASDDEMVNTGGVGGEPTELLATTSAGVDDSVEAAVSAVAASELAARTDPVATVEPALADEASAAEIKIETVSDEDDTDPGEADAWGETSSDVADSGAGMPTTNMAQIDSSDDGDDEEFRFSFDGERR